MPPPPPDDSSSPLAAHVESLYALAQVLVGAEEAGAMVQSVYERAAEVPPGQRPSDQRAWLFRLMVDAQEGDLHSAGAEVHPGSDTSFTDDPFRREVAEQTAERVLPVAFAACSLHERFILAVDVLGDPPTEVLAAALDTTAANARSVRDQARSALRASLRDVLKGPERMLVDVALPEEVLRDQLRALLLDRFSSAPDGLHSTVGEILAQAQAEHLSSSEATAKRALLPQAREAVQQWLSLRGLLGGLAFVLIITAGIGGANYFLSSASPDARPSSPSIVDLSVERADRVEMALATSDAEEAAAYVHRTWDRRVSIPSIQGASLSGVGQLSLAMATADTTVPVLRYRDAEKGTDMHALLFNYALLDTLGDRVTLDRQRRTKLAANRGLLTARHLNQAVVLWRQRDDIVVLVAPNTDPDRLQARIQL